MGLKLHDHHYFGTAEREKEGGQVCRSSLLNYMVSDHGGEMDVLGFVLKIYEDRYLKIRKITQLPCPPDMPEVCPTVQSQFSSVLLAPPLIQVL